MKILMTGGTGLVGNRLGQELVRQGHKVVLLAREGEMARAKLSYPCEIFEWSGEEAPPTYSLEGVEGLIHLAGENIAGKRWSKERKKKLRNSRIETAKSLSRAFQIRGAPLKVFISASAVGIYGDRGDEVLSESSVVGNGFLSELCQEWELAGKSVPSERHVFARFGIVLSELGGFLDQVVPMFRMFGASRLGSGQQYISWIHLDDLVNMLMSALTDSRYSGAINTVSPEPVTNKDLTAELAEVLKTFMAPPVPALALKLLYGELFQTLLGSQRVVPEVLQKLGFKFQHTDLKKTLAVIYPKLEAGDVQLTFEHWVPAPLQEVWDFYSSEKNLERITPPTMHFHVVNKSTEDLKSQTLIDYKLKVHGVPLRWRTLIDQWQPKKRFSDVQLKGPYKKWHHLHEFSEFGGGVLTRDQVHFQLPMGMVGRLGSLALVLKDVRNIFAYRAKVITQVFGPR